ncbi:MAG: mechanosensitive ion channel [Planctomycetota bacterium]|nr:mechanosensitive ion channel [Planctomycetota bacterium]
MQELLNLIRDRKVVTTLEVVAAFFLVLLLARIVLRRSALSPDQKLRVRSFISTGGILVVAASLVSIWAEMVQELLVALTAFAVAAVIASKELILCVLGWVYKALSGTHHTGDRIQVGEIRGDVVTVRILSSTLLEVDKATDHSTGRLLTLPHALLLTLPCYNETQGEALRWLEIPVKLAGPEELEAAQRALEASAAPVQADYRETILRRRGDLEEDYAVRMKNIEPKVYLSHDGGKPVLTLRIAVPSRAGRDTQDRLLRAYYEARAAAEKKSEP